MRSPTTWHRSLPTALRLGLALAAFALAWGLRAAVLPVEAGLAYLTFFPATLVAFWLAGFWPGQLVVGLSVLVAHRCYMPPFDGFVFDTRALVSLAVFVTAAQLMGALTVHSQRALRQGEQALRRAREAEQQLQQVLDDQSDVIIRYTADQTVQYVNDAFCRTFGLSRSELLGSRWAPLVWPDDLPAVVAAVASLSREQPEVQIENRVRVSDGSMRWMHWHNRVVDWDADGRPWEVQAVARDTTERRGLMAELAEARDELLDLHDHAPCGYHSLDAEGRFVRINATELAWLGCRREDLIGRETPLRFFTDEGRAIFQERMPLFVHGPDAEFRAELDLVSLDGTRRRVNVSATKVVDAQGRFVRSRSVMHDITETHRLREQLQRLNRELFAMLDNDLIGIVRLKQRRAVWKNRGLELLTGYGHEELIGQSSRMLYPDEATWQAFGAAAEASFAAGRRHVGDVAMRRKDGSEMMVRLRGERIGNADDEVLWVLVDVTEQRRQLQATERLAFHDALTGLPNRLLMSDRLSQALALAEREQHHVAVGYVDLDGFKAINDAHGHEAGDAVLQAVAQRLSHAVRPHDSVARFGGDEFVILLTQLHDDREHLAVAHRLEQCIAEPIPWQGLSLGVGMSLAFARYPADSRDPDDLLRLADQGMYRIKARHRDAARSTEAGGLTAPADLRP